MKLARVILIVVGLLLLVLGGVVLLGDVPPARYLGILAWFAGALVLHDGIIAPIVFGVGLILRRAGRRIPFAVIAIVQGAIVVAAIMTAIVVPEILKQNIGSANASLLPLPYLANLGWFYLGLAVVTALAIVGTRIAVRARRSGGRPTPGPSRAI